MIIVDRAVWQTTNSPLGTVIVSATGQIQPSAAQQRRYTLPLRNGARTAYDLSRSSCLDQPKLCLVRCPAVADMLLVAGTQ